MHVNKVNALTVDVEDYFQVSAFEKNINRSSWGDIESRVEKNTRNLLEVFSEQQITATFFVLGWVAERFPTLIREIDELGHEVASHGYSHQLVYNQTPDLFREETVRSKNILEDIVQKPVLGYRAASYSITQKSMWALDILHEAGFKYDSSIFPVRHDRYGLPGSPRFPYALKTPKQNKIVEFPLTSFQYMRMLLPIAGGGYFRLFPYWFTKYAFNKINNNENEPFIFYLHPWEIDPEQPKIKGSMLSRFRHYNNLHKCKDRLEKLLTDFEFSSAYNVLESMGFLSNTDFVDNLKTGS
jgi:polysaccharide deacetylase family protein (PEP-CTERM system associated)